jgi:hypothetical protein
MDLMRDALYAAAKAVFVVVLALWFLASCVAAYVALLGFWPMLSLVFAIGWASWRITGHADGAVVSVERRPARQRRIKVDGSDLPLGKRVLVTVDPRFSVELAAPRWVEALSLLLWAPFVLQAPLFGAPWLLEMAGREQPHVVVEWSWLPIGTMLFAGFGVGLVAFVAWAGRDFVGPGTIGKRIEVPLLGRALCLSHADVCAIEVGRDSTPSHRAADHIRVIRTNGEPVELIPGAWALPDAGATPELLPLAGLIARAARVPLRPLSEPRNLGTRN